MPAAYHTAASNIVIAGWQTPELTPLPPFLTLLVLAALDDEGYIK